MSETVLYSCGHTAPRTQSYQPWHKCPECHRAQDGAAKRNQEAGLPPLDGTEKQKHFAESIRDKAHRSLRKFLEQWAEVKAVHADQIVSRIGTLTKQILAQTSSAWWIERKEIDWELSVMTSIMREKPGVLISVKLPRQEEQPKK